MLPTLKRNDEDKMAGVVPVQRYIQILHFQTQSYHGGGVVLRSGIGGMSVGRETP